MPFKCNIASQLGLWFCFPVQDYCYKPLRYPSSPLSHLAVGCSSHVACVCTSRVLLAYLQFCRFPYSLVQTLLLCSHHPYAFLCIFLAWHLSSFPPPFKCICLLSSECTPKYSCSVKIHKPSLTNIILSHSQISYS